MESLRHDRWRGEVRELFIAWQQDYFIITGKAG